MKEKQRTYAAEMDSVSPVPRTTTSKSEPESIVVVVVVVTVVADVVVVLIVIAAASRLADVPSELPHRRRFQRHSLHVSPFFFHHPRRRIGCC